jgi:hypothetical protein
MAPGIRACAPIAGSVQNYRKFRISVGEADAEVHAVRVFLAGENHACITLYRHNEMHFHTPQTPLDCDAARRK